MRRCALASLCLLVIVGCKSSTPIVYRADLEDTCKAVYGALKQTMGRAPEHSCNDKADHVVATFWHFSDSGKPAVSLRHPGDPLESKEERWSKPRSLNKVETVPNGGSSYSGRPIWRAIIRCRSTDGGTAVSVHIESAKLYSDRSKGPTGPPSGTIDPDLRFAIRTVDPWREEFLACLNRRLGEPVKQPPANTKPAK